MSHEHRCQACGYCYHCDQHNCKVEKAAKVNGQGPFCECCRNLEMARRVCKVRGWVDAEFKLFELQLMIKSKFR